MWFFNIWLYIGPTGYQPNGVSASNILGTFVDDNNCIGMQRVPVQRVGVCFWFSISLRGGGVSENTYYGRNVVIVIAFTPFFFATIKLMFNFFKHLVLQYKPTHSEEEWIIFKKKTLFFSPLISVKVNWLNFG